MGGGGRPFPNPEHLNRRQVRSNQSSGRALLRSFRVVLGERVINTLLRIASVLGYEARITVGRPNHYQECRFERALRAKCRNVSCAPMTATRGSVLFVSSNVSRRQSWLSKCLAKPPFSNVLGSFCPGHTHTHRRGMMSAPLSVDCGERFRCSMILTRN